ncbi:hypothetical protein Pla108_00990 [Botrimarina colliarenosi]|uniref:Uncharacterized protein n=1 Tax=Botrimarina colliarenosi TaxID=2528001 RepID=A0A5C6AJ20_9BACT|nr:hypothetical protein [Botrimarina colliarenosi]TWT99165.1 hypothetical protein Pla108_00990 [Botrimarina colliarenosi]
MTSSTRTGRRRRMLHDGAATPSAPLVDDENSGGAKVRYTPPTDSASFAVGSRVLPRSPLALGGMVAGLLAVTALLGWADGIGASASGVGASAAQLLQVSRPGSVAAWWETGLWLAVGGQCVLLFGMRRHRTNDLGGSYRWWLFAAATAIGMSISSATHANQVVASELAALTGFSPLAGDLLWRIVPGGLIVAAVAVVALLEVRECSAATAFAASAGGATVVSLAATAGVVPAAAPWLAPGVLGPIATTAAAVLALASLMAYSRRIVRETLGEVTAPVVKKAAAPTRKVANSHATEADDADETTKKQNRAVTLSTETEDPAPAPSSAMKKTQRETSRPKLAEETTDSSRWVSGAEGYHEEYDDEGGPEVRKRTKAERKKLRREKERRAA